MKNLQSNKCEKCDKTFTTRGNLSIHIKAVHDQVKYDCVLCDKSFSQELNLKRHKKVKHEGFRLLDISVNSVTKILLLQDL